jgi:hypothetical protein
MASPALDTASAVTVSRAPTQQPRTISQVASAVLAVVGISEFGPMDVLTECDTFEGYQQLFGGYTANNLETMAAIDGWFSGGGGTMFFVRTCHHTTPGDPTTATATAATLSLETAATVASAGSVTAGDVAPFALSPGQTLVVSVNGGGNQTATFNATAASKTSVGTAPFDLANNDVLNLSINGTAVPGGVTFQTGSFVSIAAATALEVCAVINARFDTLGIPAVATPSTGAIEITTTQMGEGASVQITAGGAQASGKLNFATSIANGTGNVQNIANVTVAEVISVVGAALVSPAATVTNSGGAPTITSNTTGGSSSVQVMSSSTAVGLAFDNAPHTGSTGAAQATLTAEADDGSYANTITLIVAPSTSGDPTAFNLQFLQAGVVTDTFSNVYMDPTNVRYVLDVVNGNNTLGITLTDLLVAPSPANLPTAGTFGPLTGGSDGLSGLVDADFVGGVTANGKTGLRAVDADQGAVTILIVPQRPTPAVHNAMVSYCNITRSQQMFAILDPPMGQTVAQIVNYVANTAVLVESAEVAAFYYPNIMVATPNATLYGANNVVVPPSGDLAALYARTDATLNIGGAFQQPGGINFGIPRMLALESTQVLDKSQRDILTAVLINPISKETGTAFFVDGVLSLMSGGNFPSIGQSRGVLTVAKSLTQGLAFARHQNNTPELRKSCSDLTTQFLTQVTGAGVLATQTAADAFTVDFGKGLNPPSVQAQRSIRGRAGIATAFPADYIFVDIFPDNAALDAELAAAA